MPIKLKLLAVLVSFAALSPSALADEVPAASVDQPSLFQRYTAKAQETTQAVLGQALDLLGIRYRKAGSAPESGFDCSGFVGHVFREGLGMILPRSAREISQTGEPISKEDLKPGDLVFFNTMRRTFSHVGIYLGNNQFIHAPRTGAQIRIEDMGSSYWTKRYEGARRMTETN